MKKPIDDKIEKNYQTTSIAVGTTTYLDKYWKKKYENFFGVKLPTIKIHKDTASLQKAQKYNAHSYTQGKNIYFGKDTKSLDTIDGQSLLAHEITHILQQENLDFSQRKGIDKDTNLENKAQIVEKRVLDKKGINESSFEYFRKWDVLPQRSLNKKINNIVQRKLNLSASTKLKDFNYNKSAYTTPLSDNCALNTFNTKNNAKFGLNYKDGLQFNLDTNNSILNLGCDNKIYDGKNVDVNLNTSTNLNSINAKAGLGLSKKGLSAKAGLMYSYFDAKFGGGLDINLPFIDYTFSPSLSLTGMAGSLGAEADGYIGKSNDGKFGIGGSLGLSALFGAKLKLGLDFKKREEEPIQRKSTTTRRTFDEEGIKDFKRVEKNYKNIILHNRKNIGFRHSNEKIQQRINAKYTQTIKYGRKDYKVKVRSGLAGTELYAVAEVQNSRPKGIKNKAYYRDFANRAIAKDDDTQKQMNKKFNKKFIFSSKRNPYYIEDGEEVLFEWHHLTSNVKILNLIKRSIHRKYNKALHLKDGRGGHSLFNTNGISQDSINKNTKQKSKNNYFKNKINKIQKFAYRDEKSIYKQANKYAKKNIKANKKGQKTSKIFDLQYDFISHTQEFGDNKLGASLNIASDALTMMKLNKDGRTKEAIRYKMGAQLLLNGANAVNVYDQFKGYNEDPSVAGYLSLSGGILGLAGEVAHTTKLDKKAKFINQQNIKKAQYGLSAGADVAGGISGISSFVNSKDKRWGELFHSSSDLAKGLGEGAKFLKRDLGFKVKGSKQLGHLSNNLEKIGNTLAFMENTSAFVKGLKNGEVNATQALAFVSSTASTIKSLADSKVGSKVMDKMPFLKKFGFITKVLAFMQGANSVLSSEILVTPIKFATAVATSIGSFVGTIANKVGGKVVASVVASMTAGIGALLYPVVSYFSGMLIESGIGILYEKYVKSPIVNKIASIHQAILDKGQEIPIVSFFMPLFSGDYTGFFKNFMSIIQPKAIYNFVDNYLETKFPIMWKGIKYGASAIAKGVSSVASATVNAVSSIWNFEKKIISSGINGITSVAKGAMALGAKTIDTVTAIGGSVVNGAKAIGSGVSSFVGSLFGTKEEKKPTTTNISTTVANKYNTVKNNITKFINPFKESSLNWLEEAHQNNTNAIPKTVVTQQKEEPKEEKHWWNFAKTNRHQMEQTNFEQTSNKEFDITSIENQLDDWAEKIFRDLKNDVQLEYIRAGRD